jgi:lipopolysaccharide/colanic/teichoic acid biosynthesis glycosyltransferase
MTLSVEDESLATLVPTRTRPQAAPETRQKPEALPAQPRAESRRDPDWEALAPKSFYARRVRRPLDLALLALVLPPAAALGLVVALVNAIVLGDPRRVLFVQPRAGLRGKVFRLVKFRTMREAPEGNFAAWENGDRLRVTRFGRILRSSHLDELPQLLNVVSGTMGFIGPRPEMLEVEDWAREHVPGFAERLAVRPGITGLAQVTQGYTGRDVAAYAEKLAINRRYLAGLSFRLDLEILARTALWMLRGRGWSWNATSES